MWLLEQLFSTVIEIIEKVFIWSFGQLEKWLGLQPRKLGYQAYFGNPKQLLSKRNTGFNITGKTSLSLKHSYQNALIIGGTGTGKSSVVLIPSLMTMTGSFVVHDPSGELYTKSAGYLTWKGYQVLRLNFASPKTSIGFNPLARASTSSELSKVASMLVRSALVESNEPFWNFQGVSLLAAMMSILKTQEPQFQTLYHVRSMLQLMMGAPEKMDQFFAKYADASLLRTYQSFRNFDSKLLTGIVATGLAALSIFRDELVAQVTSTDTLDMQVFRKQKIALFIQNPITDQAYFSTLTSIFFEQLWQVLLRNLPTKTDQDVFFLIDEASSLYLPSLAISIANIRKYRGGMMLVLQDFNQLLHTYGRPQAETIRSNSFAKLYFTAQSMPTALELEKMLGKFQYQDDKGNTKIRPLLTNDEIRTLSPEKALLICGHYLPMKVTLTPYYQQRYLRQISNLSTPKTQTQVPQPLLSIPFFTS